MQFNEEASNKNEFDISPLDETQKASEASADAKKDNEQKADEFIYSVDFPEKVPVKLKEQIDNFNQRNLKNGFVNSKLQLDYSTDTNCESEECEILNWYYILVAPFPSLTDNIKLKDLINVWKGISDTEGEITTLYISDETYDVFSRLWGKPDDILVHIIEDDELLDTVWKTKNAYAIVPFENIEPMWKVISIDGLNLLSSGIVLENYPLRVSFTVTTQDKNGPRITEMNEPDHENLFQDNFKPEKLTSLIMTGTTALVRNTALRMEENGILYPAEDIQYLLLEADLTHISNEVPFSTHCPPAEPLRTDWKFCSDPAYLELFDYIDADIIELTGNHVMDWGSEAFLFTLDLYKENKYSFYGGGTNLEEARDPLLVEHNGNNLAFLGCNSTGPTGVWATQDTPGAASCDKEWIKQTLADLVGRGYIPIFTFQHIENCDYTPHISQQGDFLYAAESGAVIVSGSQSHCPQSMILMEDRIIHFGLGNLFFDQMDKMARRQLIDKHHFYDGRYIGTELYTTILEDYAKPRTMDFQERRDFLTSVFNASGWNK